MFHSPARPDVFLVRDAGAALAILLVVGVAWFRPFLADRVFTRMELWGGRFAEHRVASFLSTAFLVFIIRLSVLPLMAVPVPEQHDEFSYLLAADTFAHGRFANPPHPMWVFLETFHVNQFPTYVSKFPPAQGMILALGQLLGHPWIGVLASVAGLCAAITWALQGWVPPKWALLGGFLAAAQFSAANYWIDSYWGGAVAGIGGSLVIGAFPRILHWQRARDATLFALGIGILCNSRPYEGLIFCLPIIAALVWRFVRNDQLRWRVLCLRVIVPMTGVLILTGTFIAYYNWRVTGNPLVMPYTVYDRTYQAPPPVQWLKLNSPGHYSNPQFETFYDHNRKVWLHYHLGWTWEAIRYAILEKLLKLQSFYAPPELGIPIVLALFCLPQNRKIRFCFLVCGITVMGLLSVSWFEFHYAAAFTATVYVLIVYGLRVLRHWGFRGRPVGLGLARGLVLFHSAFLLACVGALAISHRTNYDPWARGQARARILAALESTPGQHLVLVRYSQKHNPDQEWVYNQANIDRAKVIWAREVQGLDIQPLLNYFCSRNFWLVAPDEGPSPKLSVYRTLVQDELATQEGLARPVASGCPH